MQPADTPKRLQIQLYIVLILLFVSVVALRYNKIEKLFESSQHDLRAYIACAHNILNDRPIYTTHHQLIPEDPTLTRDVPKFPYPPLLGILMIPTTIVSYDTFKHVWFFLNLFFLFHGIFLICRLLPIPKDTAITMFLVMSTVTVGSDWIMWLLRTAQTDAFTAYLVIWGLYFFERKKWIPCAILVASSAWVKVTPGIIFLYLITRGNLRYFVYSMAAAIVLFLFQFAVIQEQFILFFTKMLPERAASPFPVPSMQSLWALNHLLFDPHPRRYEIFNASEWVDTTLLISQIVVALTCVLVLIRKSKDAFTRFYGFGACAAASLLLTNSSWMMRYSWSYIFLSAILISMIKAKRPLIAIPFGMVCILLHQNYLIKSFFGKYEGAEQLLLGAPGFSALATVFYLTFLVVRDGGGWSPFVEIPALKLKESVHKMLNSKKASPAK